MHNDESSNPSLSPTPDRSVRTVVEPGESVSETVIMAVAALTDSEPTELDPLYDFVDPDAIDALFRHAATRDRRTNHRLSFLYHGYDVRIRCDGAIRIERV